MPLMKRPKLPPRDGMILRFAQFAISASVRRDQERLQAICDIAERTLTQEENDLLFDIMCHELHKQNTIPELNM